MKLNRLPRERARRSRKQALQSAVFSSRPVLIEPLENRQLMSLTVEVETTGGASSATVTAVGQVLNLQLVAVVSGTETAATHDGLDSVAGSIISNETSVTDSVGGDLDATLNYEYTANGASDGTQQDLNGQGNLDVGSNDTSQIAGYFNARYGGIDTNPSAKGDSVSFQIATLTYTVTNLRYGSPTDVNFTLRNGLAAGAFDAIWEEDGKPKNDSDGTVLSGTPFVITDPNLTPPTGSISGQVTKSGSAASGVSVYLDLNNDGTDDNGDPTVTTDSSGDYSFTGLAAGTYDVRQVVPSGYGQTSPSSNAPVVVNLASDSSSASGENFSDSVLTGSISGAVQQVSTSGSTTNQSGVEVYIDSNNSGSLVSGDPTTTTNGSGQYSFSGLTAGTYHIREVVPSGFSQTSPSGGAADTVSLSAGGNATGANFTNTANAVGNGSISGTVQLVSNGNSVTESGVTVYFTSTDGGESVNNVTSVVTNSSGAYTLSGLTPGDYDIFEQIPAGYTQTSPDSGLTAPSSGTPLVVDLSQGENVQGISFINTAPSTTPTGELLTGSVIGTSGSYNNDGNTIAKAFDGNLNTYFDGPSANGNWAGLNLGGEYTISGIEYAPRSGYAGRMIGGTFQGSNSSTFASGVTNLYTITAAPGAGYNAVSVSNSNSFEYVRYVSPTGSFGDVAEIQFYGNLVKSASNQLTGTVIGTSGSYNNDGNTIAKAFDGNLNTFFDGPAANGNWAGLNLGSTYAITEINYAPRSGFASRMVGGVFQASNSATFTSGVVNLATITATPATGSYTSISISNPNGFQYVRYVSPSGSWGDVAEIQVFGNPASAVTTTQLSGTAIGTSGSYNNDGNTVAKAFDGNLSTFFDGPTANGNWAGLALSSASQITQISYAPRANFASRMVGGTFQASNSSTFTSGVVNLYTITTAPVYNTLTTVNISVTGTYLYVRYVSPAGSFGDVAEIEFFG
jgi:hypothetical protein